MAQWRATMWAIVALSRRDETTAHAQFSSCINCSEESRSPLMFLLILTLRSLTP